jgi:hypothetical protein
MVIGLLTWGCSSDDDTETESVTAGADARPSWQKPNYDLYEQTMTVDVLLQDALQGYASENDLMCATVRGEVRALTAPVKKVSGQWYFPLIVASNDAGVDILLSYYCDALHRIFTTAWTKFDASARPTGTGGIYEPVFTDIE